MKTFAPHRDVARFGADGSLVTFNDYDCTTLKEGTWADSWSLVGSTLTYSGAETQQAWTLTWVTPDAVKLSGDGVTMDVYRKGHEPHGNVFDQTPVSLNEFEGYEDGSLAFGESRLYSCDISETGNHAINWSETDSDNTVGDIVVTVYGTDKQTVLAEEVDNTDITVGLNEGTRYYVIVECVNPELPGTYEIWMNKAED